MTIEEHGLLRKFVDCVAQITFSGAQAMIQGQEILYVTERAVFRLAGGQLRLEETAPGIDPQRDVLDRMAFQPIVAEDLQTMPATCFQP